MTDAAVPAVAKLALLLEVVTESVKVSPGENGAFNMADFLTSARLAARFSKDR